VPARRPQYARRTTVIEPEATRDHTERMLAAFGARIAVDTHNGERHIVVEGHHELTAQAPDGSRRPELGGVSRSSRP
jgi:5-enolpyruvylshikimate-3-phosphate synthase